MVEKRELWLNEALWDLDNAKILLKKKRYSTSIFHSQQAAEKAVKSLLFSCNMNGWGHVIISLLKKYEEIKKRDISLIEKEAIYLDKQYLPTRYPDALPGIEPHKAFDKEDAKVSLIYTEKIINFVEEEIKFFKEIEAKENDKSEK